LPTENELRVFHQPYLPLTDGSIERRLGVAEAGAV
jgi:hypothetical protein